MTLRNICLDNLQANQRSKCVVKFHITLINIYKTVITLATLLLPPCYYREPNKVACECVYTHRLKAVIQALVRTNQAVHPDL